MYGFGFIAATHSASALGMPVNAMHEDKNAAPPRINKIMHDKRVAPIKLALNDAQLSPPLKRAMTSAPNTPNAAASVAVAQPIAITHTMNTISNKHGIRLRDKYSFSRKV